MIVINNHIKKLLSILVLSLLLSGNAFAKEVVLVCKFENGNSYKINGTVDKFNKSTVQIPFEDTIFKINENRKTLIEIRPNREKIINDVKWTQAAIKWNPYKDYDPYTQWSHEINRFNGVYKYVALYDKESPFYKVRKLLRTEWFELCSTTKKLF